MKTLKILITSGGTIEHIDGVRVLTNISTGKLGAKIANTLLYRTLNIFPNEPKPNFEAEVHFVHVKNSEMPTWLGKWAKKNFFPYEVTNVQSVYEIMEKLVPEMDVVIHPMAVSDFGFRPIHTKLKSNDPDAFIESLRERIYQTPKILSHIKEWNPKCFLISFKFEDGVEHEDLLRIAGESMYKNGSDIVIANDKSEMKRAGVHRAYFITPDNIEVINGGGPFLGKVANGKEEIAEEIFNRIDSLNV